MKNKYIIISSISCLATMIGTDALSYWRSGMIVFFDLEFLKTPIGFISFILIGSGMIYGFAKFLEYQNRDKVK